MEPEEQQQYLDQIKQLKQLTYEKVKEATELSEKIKRLEAEQNDILIQLSESESTKESIQSELDALKESAAAAAAAATASSSSSITAEDLAAKCQEIKDEYEVKLAQLSTEHSQSITNLESKLSLQAQKQLDEATQATIESTIASQSKKHAAFIEQLNAAHASILSEKEAELTKIRDEINASWQAQIENEKKKGEELAKAADIDRLALTARIDAITKDTSAQIDALTSKLSEQSNSHRTELAKAIEDANAKVLLAETKARQIQEDSEKSLIERLNAEHAKEIERISTTSTTAASNEIEALKKTLAELIDSHGVELQNVKDQSVLDSDSINSQLQSAKDSLIATQESSENVSRELETSKNRCESLEATNRKSQEQIEKLTAEFQDQQAKNAEEISSILAQKQIELEESKAQLEAQSRGTQLESEAAVQQTKIENDKLKAQLNEESKLKLSAEEQLHGLTQQLEEVKSISDESIEQLRKQLLAQQQASDAALDQQVSELSAKMQQESSQALKQSKDEIAQLLSSEIALKQELLNAKEDISKNELLVSEVQSKLLVSTSTEASLQQSLKSAEEKLKTVEEQLTERITSQESSEDSYKKALADLNSQVQSKTDQLNLLQEQLQVAELKNNASESEKSTQSGEKLLEISQENERLEAANTSLKVELEAKVKENLEAIEALRTAETSNRQQVEQIKVESARIQEDQSAIIAELNESNVKNLERIQLEFDELKTKFNNVESANKEELAKEIAVLKHAFEEERVAEKARVEAEVQSNQRAIVQAENANAELKARVDAQSEEIKGMREQELLLLNAIAEKESELEKQVEAEKGRVKSIEDQFVIERQALTSQLEELKEKSMVYQQQLQEKEENRITTLNLKAGEVSSAETIQDEKKLSQETDATNVAVADPAPAAGAACSTSDEITSAVSIEDIDKIGVAEDKSIIPSDSSQQQQQQQQTNQPGGVEDNSIGASTNPAVASATTTTTTASTGEKKSKEKKSITMSVEELKALDAKIKELQKAKKSLEKENKAIKLELEEKSKSILTQPPVQQPQQSSSNSNSQQIEAQKRQLELEVKNLRIELEEQARLQQSQRTKKDLNIESLEERCKTLQSLLDEYSVNFQSADKQREEWKEKYEGIKEDFTAKEEELKIQRESAREKFRIEMALQQANSTIATLNKSLQDHEKNIMAYKQLQRENEEAKREIENLQQTIAKLQSEIGELSSKEEKHCQKQRESESIREELEQKIAYLEKQSERLKVQRDDFEAQLSQTSVSLEDSVSEAKITAKKFANEMQELKLIRDTLQASNSELKGRTESLENDVKALREANKKQFHATVDANPDAPKKDKIILESLSLRNQELEAQQKWQLERIDVAERQLKESAKVLENKLATIQFLAKELFAKNPQLEDIKDSIEQEDILEINAYKMMSYKDIQNNIEKIAIENIRLRSDILLLGKDLNDLIRQKK